MGKSIKPIAIAFADLHKNEWKNHNAGYSRLMTSISPLKLISDKALKLGVPVLFAGDWDHYPTHVTTASNYFGLKSFKENFEDRNIDLYAISGNHDMPKYNTNDKRSISHLDAYDVVFNHFHKVDFDSIELENFHIIGIPYIDGNKDYRSMVKAIGKELKKTNKPSILLIHTDLPKAVNAFGHEIGTTEGISDNLSKYFKAFNLVLSGHIHKAQKLSRKVYMLGSTTQQTTGDRGCDMGYWIVYSDFSMKFKKLKLPEFIEIDDKSKVRDDGNYYIVNNPTSKAKDTTTSQEFNSKNSKKDLAKAYFKATGAKLKKKQRQLLISILSQID